MKIIYLTNSIYEQNILENNIKIINNLEKNNNNTNKNIIVYGGNQLDSNKKIEDNDVYINFISKINKINTDYVKYILYGSLDFDLETNCCGLTEYIDSYKIKKNFIDVFNVDYKLISSDTIIIFLNNFFNITDNMDTNITSTCLKNLISIEPSKYKDDMKVGDLVELQINKLLSIIKKNINAKTIIFASQTPLVVPDYINKKNNINKTQKFIEFFNRCYYLLSYLNLYWVCGDLKPRNENCTIKIVKKDNSGNKIFEIIVEQFIIGTNLDKIDLEKINEEYGIVGEEYNSQHEIYDGILDTKCKIDVIYEINGINNNVGYFEIDLNNNLDDNSIYLRPNLEYIDINKIKDKKKSKLEELKNDIKSKNIFGLNILDNVELSIDDSSNEEIDNQLTEEGDPYKSKYLKYKKKLYKLRNDKKY
jgi:hypothetical protein